MLARKDVRITFRVLLVAALIGVPFEARPISALTKAKKDISDTVKKGRAQSAKNAGAKNIRPFQYKVKAGDNLYRISIKHKVSIDDLMRVNNLKNSGVYAGMTLKIPADSETPAERNAGKKVFFNWPVKKVMFCKEDGFDGVKSIGIIISAPAGSFVYSSARGIVEKVGFMRGYGNFVLVKHPDNYFTIYSYLENIRVKKGQALSQGTIIGRVDSDKKSMHFQIDHNGKSINPLNYLPKKK